MLRPVQQNQTGVKRNHTNHPNKSRALHPRNHLPRQLPARRHQRHSLPRNLRRKHKGRRRPKRRPKRNRKHRRERRRNVRKLPREQRNRVQRPLSGRPRHVQPHPRSRRRHQRQRVKRNRRQSNQTGQRTRPGPRLWNQSDRVEVQKVHCPLCGCRRQRWTWRALETQRRIRNLSVPLARDNQLPQMNSSLRGRGMQRRSDDVCE
mmetsp:Transcript_45165/g.106588  ORF Transcript_45165/g.106588 Transcript_45165/m.106588 type:complete len:205 (-) Transcript_45165:663-1277(-)